MKIFLSATLCILFFSCASQLIKSGSWQGIIHYEEVDVPFTFEVRFPLDDIPEITIVNGGDRRIIQKVTIEADSIFIPIEPFDVELRAAYTAMGMVGHYHKYYRGLKVPFTASYGKPRMRKRSVQSSPIIENRWSVTFSPGTPQMSRAVGLFAVDGSQVSGTLMTEVSDYRFFEGILDGDSIKLSCFDGAHAFAFLGKKEANKWIGEMVYENGYSESWEARYDKEAELTNPFEMVLVEPGKERPYYDLLGAGQGRNAIDPSRYVGKVLIIQLFGTWCPNSYDQTQYLVRWYGENKDREVAILASSFEANYTQAYGLDRLEKYRNFNRIPYDVVLGGSLSKTGAATPFPFMQRIAAFPTLVIVDKQGFVRYVHSYFNGPATGVYYQAFDKRFNEIIDSLLAE